MFNSSSIVTSFDAGRLAAERHHLEVEAVLQPQLVHNADDLQCQHVLAEVVAHLQCQHNSLA